MPDEERQTAAAVMTVALDDASPKVRLALAEGLAACEHAPHHVVVALARDHPAIATTIMASPLLNDGEVIRFLQAGDEACALAVANRPALSPELARAVIEHGGADAVQKVLDHPSLQLGPDALERIAYRFGEAAAIRARLLAGEGLSASTAAHLRSMHVEALATFAANRNWISQRRARDLRIRADETNLVADASGLDAPALDALVAEAITSGRLTSAALLRAAIMGQCAFVERALAHLADAAPGRVAAMLGARRAGPLRALFLRAGVGRDNAELIVAAHTIWRAEARHAFADAQTERTRVLRRVVRTLATEVAARRSPSIVRLLADLELEIERHAAMNHEEQPLLAA